MRRFTIELSRRARDAIQAHADYVAIDLGSPGNARRWLSRLLDSIESLANMPTRFAIDERESARGEGIVYRLTFERACVLRYEVDESAAIVRVLSFHHGGHA